MDPVLVAALFAGAIALVTAIGGMIIQIITALRVSTKQEEAKVAIVNAVETTAEKQLEKSGVIEHLVNATATAAQQEIKELRQVITTMAEAALAKAEAATAEAEARQASAEVKTDLANAKIEQPVATRTERQNEQTREL